MQDSNLPRIATPLDVLNDPVGTDRKNKAFADWLLSLDYSDPFELSVRFGPFDQAPRDWYCTALTPDQYVDGEPCLRLVVSITDAFDIEVVDMADMAVLPPLDADVPNWKEGMAALLTLLPGFCADLQTDNLGRCFSTASWDAESFLEQTQALYDPSEQRRYLQAMWRIFTLRSLVDSAEMTDDDRERAYLLIDTNEAAWQLQLAEDQHLLSDGIDQLIADILDNDGK